MRKTFKNILIGAITFLLGLCSIVSISFFNHQFWLKKEKALLVAPGAIVKVNGCNMHVYSEGVGKETLVFMAGGGTSTPLLDFKSLYSKLSNQYQIVVLEKAGYGFSDNTNNSRDIVTILAESRLALQKAGVSGPYVLFAHSMSGIEALYWAQKYPLEVKAIVGLDMVVPQTYNAYSPNKMLVNLSAFGARIGITRFFPNIVNDSAAIKAGNLNETDQKLYRALFYHRTMTRPMINEVMNIKTNAALVDSSGNVDIPMLFFISNGKETGWDQSDWVNYQKQFIKNTSNQLNRYIETDYPHYIHNFIDEEIAFASDNFIQEVNKVVK